MLAKMILKNAIIFILFLASSISLKGQALVTLNPYQYYNKRPGDYLYFQLLNSPEKLSPDQLAYAQISTISYVQRHSFIRAKFYDLKNIERFLKNCNCPEFKEIVKELDRWFAQYGSETFKNGYSLSSLQKIEGIMKKYNELNLDALNEFKENWFFAQDFIIQPDGNSYKLQKKPSKFIYKLPYINKVEEFKFNRVDNLVQIKNSWFLYGHYNYFIYDSIHEQSIYKYANTGFLKYKTIAQVKDRVLYKTTYNYQNSKIKEASSNKSEERFYHKNGLLSFSLPYGQEVESVIGYDSLGNISFKDGNGTIFNIIDSDINDENISFNRTYKNSVKISEKQYFGNKLIKCEEFSDNNVSIVKYYHWKNGKVIKADDSNIDGSYLFHNFPNEEDIILYEIYIQILPDDLVSQYWVYPMSSSKFIPAKIENESEVVNYIKKNYKTFISKQTISESPILDLQIDLASQTQTIDYYAFFQSKINEIVKISTAKYDGKEVNVPLKMYITLVFK